MKYRMVAAIALATLTFGVSDASFAADGSATEVTSSIHVDCKTIKKSYNFMEVYRANKAVHPEWSEKQIQLATERTLSLLIAAMDICEGKTQLHVVRSGMLAQ